jgi:parvulin-like peptidyl-prolyl isomerase
MKKILTSSIIALSLFSVSSLNAKNYASVDGVNIDDKDIASILAVVPGAKFDTLAKEQKKKIVEQAIEKKLLSKKALSSGIQNEKEYKDALAKIEADLALEVWMKKQFDSINLSDADVKAFYDKNKQMFQQPETAKARHILVAKESEAKSIIAALKKAKNVKEKFMKLAAEKSTGPSGKNGGDLGWFDAKRMVPEFSKAAFALKKGTFTNKPVKTQFGYHVIYLEDKKPAKKVELKDAKKGIEQNLKVQKFQEKMKKLSKELRLKADVKINSFK